MHKAILAALLSVLLVIVSCSGSDDGKTDLTVSVETDDVYATSSVLPSDGNGNILENYDISHYRFFLYSGRSWAELLADSDPVESDFLERGETFTLRNIVSGLIWKAEVIAYIDSDGGDAIGEELIPIASGVSGPTVIAGNRHYIPVILDELAATDDEVINKHHPSETEGESSIKPGSAKITVILPPGIERDDDNAVEISPSAYISYALLDRDGTPVSRRTLEEELDQNGNEYSISIYDGETGSEFDRKYSAVVSIEQIEQGAYTIIIEVRDEEGSSHIFRQAADTLLVLPGVESEGTIDLYDISVSVSPDIQIIDSLGQTIDIVAVSHSLSVMDGDEFENDLSISLSNGDGYSISFFIDGEKTDPDSSASAYIFKDIKPGEHKILVLIEKDDEPLTVGSSEISFRVDFPDGTIGGRR